MTPSDPGAEPVVPTSEGAVPRDDPRFRMAVTADGPNGAARDDRTRWRPRWSVNPIVAFGVAAAVLLAGAALVSGRPELALLALPGLLTAAFGIDNRPRRAAGATVTTHLTPDEDGSGVGYAIRFDVPEHVEAVAVHMVGADERIHRFAVSTGATAAGPASADGAGAAGAEAARPAGGTTVRGRIPVTHSGPQQIVRLHYSLLAAGGGALSSPDPGPESSRLIPPPRLRMESLPMPLRVIGITGAHDSHNPGDGGEFRDVALFQPGDRLRRIDWKATARRAQRPGELYVRRTFSTADAIVVLVLDDRDDLGADVSRWAGARGTATTATSLDLGREAAASLAAAYVAAGDRVGLRDLAGTARSVEPGGGTRHLDRLRSTIATAVPTGEPSRNARTPLVPSSALVVVLSTFLDDQAATMAITWASTGHRVIAVDTLPTPFVKGATREESAAFRLLMVERTDRIDGMTASGVERVRWQPDESGRGPSAMPAAVQLRMLSRPRRTR